MKFGSREVCDVIFRAKSKMKLGSRIFYKDDPVLLFDTLKTSNFEGAGNTVYATGGRGASRLLAWDGEKTLTFTMEDALISPEGLAILAGADLAAEGTAEKPLYQHKTTVQKVTIDSSYKVSFSDEELMAEMFGIVDYTADGGKTAASHVFFIPMENGEINGEPVVAKVVTATYDEGTPKSLTKVDFTFSADHKVTDQATYLIDYYVKKQGNSFNEIQINPDFAINTYYYIEGETLYRRESDGVDLPATLVIPNGKIQSSFTMNMANSGDPSTYSFKVDAMPGYTKFDTTKKVLATIQIENTSAEDEKNRYNTKYGG